MGSNSGSASSASISATARCTCCCVTAVHSIGRPATMGRFDGAENITWIAVSIGEHPGSPHCTSRTDIVATSALMSSGRRSLTHCLTSACALRLRPPSAFLLAAAEGSNKFILVLGVGRERKMVEDLGDRAPPRSRRDFRTQ
jgi:hypothetical protein